MPQPWRCSSVVTESSRNGESSTTMSTIECGQCHPSASTSGVEILTLAVPGRALAAELEVAEGGAEEIGRLAVGEVVGRHVGEVRLDELAQRWVSVSGARWPRAPPPPAIRSELGRMSLASLLPCIVEGVVGGGSIAARWVMATGAGVRLAPGGGGSYPAEWWLRQSIPPSWSAGARSRPGCACPTPPPPDRPRRRARGRLRRRRSVRLRGRAGLVRRRRRRQPGLRQARMREHAGRLALPDASPTGRPRPRPASTT